MVFYLTRNVEAQPKAFIMYNLDSEYLFKTILFWLFLFINYFWII